MYAAAYIYAKVIGDLKRRLSEITVSARPGDAELKDDQLRTMCAIYSGIANIENTIT